MRPRIVMIYVILFAAAGLAGGVLAFGAGDSLVGGSVDAETTAREVIASAAAPASFAPAAASGAAAPSYRWFPALFEPEVAAASVPPAANLPSSAAAGPEGADPGLPVLANNQILAFYGQPNSKRMGILGEYSMEELSRLLAGYARLYDEANGPDGVVPAFYLIYGTCWPEGEIGYLKDSTVASYIDFARERGILVFVDHQIGKYSVAEAVERLLPFLKYPNVHLALDPEWRTTAPKKEIGGISAEELNEAQAAIQRYLDREAIPGVKMLVVHQFKGRMIEGREKVRADFERVILIHTADGFGPPALKRSSYSYNAQARNMPLKGFKLFFKTAVPGAGYDDPLLTPPDVLALDPRPVLVIYQ